MFVVVVVVDDDDVVIVVGCHTGNKELCNKLGSFKVFLSRPFLTVGNGDIGCVGTMCKDVNGEDKH